MRHAALVVLLACSITSAYLGAQATFFLDAGRQCGGAGGTCASAGSNLCGDGPWTGYLCTPPAVCMRQSSDTWTCALYSPPPPPWPPFPPRPPLAPSPPAANCTASSLVDPTSPASACTLAVSSGACSAASTTTTMVLVFSDEFSDEARNMSVADRHAVWTAHDQWWSQEDDQSAYKPGAVTTRACNATAGEDCETPGLLEVQLSATGVATSWSSDLEGDTQPSSARQYQSGMLSSWNKLCFTGGYLEARIKLPGDGLVGGMWPGLWLMGNLGRPGFARTLHGMWPYSINTCTATNPGWVQGTDNKPGLTFNRCVLDSTAPLDWAKGTARSVPQINVLRAKLLNSTSTPSVMASSGLLMAPLLPYGYTYNSGAQTSGSCMQATGQWVDTSVLSASLTADQCLRPRDGTEDGGPGLCSCAAVPGGRTSSCGTLTDARTGNLDADVLSASVQLGAAAFSGFHTYGVWWQPNSGATTQDGFVRFYVDGQPFYEVSQAALAALTGSNSTTLTPERIIPYEPMHIVLNLGLNSYWSGSLDTDALAATLPVGLLVDYVRLYQEQSKVNLAESLSCSPPSRPTAQYIACNPEDFVLCPNTPWNQCPDYQVLREQVGECTHAVAAPPPPPPSPPSPPAYTPKATLAHGQQCGGMGGGCLSSDRATGSLFYGECSKGAWSGWACGSGLTCEASSASDTTPMRMYCKSARVALGGGMRWNLGSNSSVTGRGGVLWSASKWQSAVTPSSVGTNSTTATIAGTTVSATVDDRGMWGSWIEAPTFTLAMSPLTAGTRYTTWLYLVEPWYTAPGQRVFSVSVDGTKIGTIDPFANCTGTLIGCTVSFDATPSSSSMSVTLTASTTAGAVLSAIEVVPYTAPPPSPPGAKPPPSPAPSPPPGVGSFPPPPPGRTYLPPSAPLSFTYSATFLVASGSMLAATDAALATLVSSIGAGTSVSVAGYSIRFTVGVSSSTCTDATLAAYIKNVASALGTPISSVTAQCTPPPPSPPAPFPPPPPPAPPTPSGGLSVGRRLHRNHGPAEPGGTAQTIGAHSERGGHVGSEAESEMRSEMGSEGGSEMPWQADAEKVLLKHAVGIQPQHMQQLQQMQQPLQMHQVEQMQQLQQMQQVEQLQQLQGAPGRRLQAGGMQYFTTAAITNTLLVSLAPQQVCTYLTQVGSACVASLTDSTATLLGTQLLITTTGLTSTGKTTADACETTETAVLAALATVFPTASGGVELVGSPACVANLPPSPPTSDWGADAPVSTVSNDDGPGRTTVIALAVGVGVGGLLVLLALVALFRWASKSDDDDQYKPLPEQGTGGMHEPGLANLPLMLGAAGSSAVAGGHMGGHTVQAVRPGQPLVPRARAGVVGMGEDSTNVLQKMWGAVTKPFAANHAGEQDVLAARLAGKLGPSSIAMTAQQRGVRGGDIGFSGGGVGGGGNKVAPAVSPAASPTKSALAAVLGGGGLGAKARDPLLAPPEPPKPRPAPARLIPAENRQEGKLDLLGPPSPGAAETAGGGGDAAPGAAAAAADGAGAAATTGAELRGEL